MELYVKMSYRPICDMWILARPKVKYYGSYPSGFLLRARDMIGCSLDDCVLHVCSGMVKDYVYKGFGVNDKTVDIDDSLNPDFVMDVVNDLPVGDWDGVLIDTPYSEKEAENYRFVSYPKINNLLRDVCKIIGVGVKVGILHYNFPQPPKNMRLMACVGVLMGYNNKIRLFSVYEKVEVK